MQPAHEISFSTYKEQTLKNGETYAYREICPKDKPECDKCVIFLQSNMFTSNLWRVDNFIDDLVPIFPDCRLYALDFRGTGHSSYKNKLARFKDLVEDVSQFMECKNIKKVLFVGHCTGGFIAQLFATCYPEKTYGMILLDAPTFEHPPCLERHMECKECEKAGEEKDKCKSTEEIKNTKAYKCITAALEKQDKEFMRSQFKEMTTEKPAHQDDLIDDMLRNKSVFDWMMAECSFKGEDDTKLSGMKVLMISGERDKYVTKEIIDRLAEKIGPDCKKVCVKDSSHVTWMTTEGKKCTVKAIEEFVKTFEKSPKKQM